jgi:membrane associated rhomboid family serine protease
MNGLRGGGLFSSLPPVIKNILLINVIVFVGSYLLEQMGSNLPIHLALFNFRSEYFQPFQLITYMFMHGGLGHLFFNMFAVFMFGRVLEGVWGGRRMFVFYMFTGLGAALLHLLINHFQINQMISIIQEFNSNPSPDMFWSIVQDYDIGQSKNIVSLATRWFENPDNPQLLNQAKAALGALQLRFINIPTVGASGAVFGILTAFAMLFPNVELMLIFFPVPIKAKYFVGIYAVMELFFGIANFRMDNVAHFAHLGGALIGFIIVRIWKNNQFKQQ